MLVARLKVCLGAHNSHRPPLSNKPLRIGARAVVVERVQVVGGCVAGSCADLLRWEMGNGADVSRSQTFHPLPLAQTVTCESTLQLLAVVTHHSTAQCSPLPPLLALAESRFLPNRLATGGGGGGEHRELDTRDLHAAVWGVIDAMFWFGTYWNSGAASLARFGQPCSVLVLKQRVRARASTTESERPGRFSTPILIFHLYILILRSIRSLITAHKCLLR